MQNPLTAFNDGGDCTFYELCEIWRDTPLEYQLNIQQLQLVEDCLTVTLTGYVVDPALSAKAMPRPKVVLFFENGQENRRIPLVIQDIRYIQDRCLFTGSYTYKLGYIYWSTRGKLLPGTMRLDFSYGNFYKEGADFYVDPQGVQIESKLYRFEPKENLCLVEPLPTRRSARWKNAILRPLQVLFCFLSYCIALCLLPWFFLEALLSFVGITKLDPKVKSPNPLRRIIGHLNQRVYRFSSVKITLSKLYRGTIQLLYRCFCLLPIQQNRITFISMRRTDLSGNFAFVHEQMKDRTDLKLRFILTYHSSAFLPPLTMLRFCYACAVSKVIVLDEFTPQIHYINLRPSTKVIQLWHACGAFKTFGFTRLGKPAGSPQPTRNHRNYDYVTVSSTYCKRCHSEGFGISDEKVVPTGIARTDVFFDEAYKQRVRAAFYDRYPGLKDKKIILFAPTFRGTVKETAYYPVERFDLKTVYETVGSEYAILVKHHPFVSQKQPIPEEYRDSIIDLSENSELNDLLFVTDLVITDYSSLIFEAALLKIPMLFYVFDLQEYIRDRDFYFDLSLNSPGKLVYTQKELTDAICREDYESDRLDAFAKMFFDHFDGQSTRRIVQLIEKALTE